MNSPSTLSHSIIPPENSSGSVSTAYHGSPSVTAAAVPASSSTSVAVSKPKPNTKPTKNSCQVCSIELHHAPEEAVHETAREQLRLEFLLRRRCRGACRERRARCPPAPPGSARRSSTGSPPTAACRQRRRPSRSPSSASPRALNTAFAAIVMPTPTTMITLECPSAKKKPVPSGRPPSAISLRVELSIAAM